MPNALEKSPRNVAGQYYVDTTCVDCDMCREIAGRIFSPDDESGLSFVRRQPDTEADRLLAEEARQSCPTESIGNDGAQPRIAGQSAA